MNFIKILLFALLFSILFFVYLEVEKTNNSMIITQGHKPKEKTIYREGKAIKISHKEYAKLEAIPSINENLSTTHDTEASEIKTLQLSGVIPDGLNYTIKTFYTSDSKGYICGRTSFSLGIFGGKSGFYLTNSTKVATYSPIIKDGRHSIEVPLNEFQPIVGCNYHLSLIQMKISNSNLKNDNHNMPYGGYFKLFFPNGTSSQHITVGSPYNHNIGKKIDMECTVKDLNDEVSFFSSNCHLKSTLNTFFTAQELDYPKYELNINTNTQEEHKVKLFLQSEDYTSRVTFMKRISHLAKFHEKKLGYFIQSIEKLDNYQNRVTDYLDESKEKLTNLLINEKERLTDNETKLLEGKLKRLKKSIQSHKKIMKIEKELLYDANNIAELDALNKKIKIDKLFLDNEFYKYEMLHLANLAIKSPNSIYHKIYSLKKAHEELAYPLSKYFLNCKKSNTFLYKKLKSIRNSKKETDTKKLLKNIKNLESLLFLKNHINYYYLIHELNNLAEN